MLLLSAGAAHATLDQNQAGPSALCRGAIAATERETRIPDAFLSAISRVESGRPQAGTIDPWPWTVNAAGVGHFYASKAEAIAAVHAFQASGIRSVDVGCLQVNLMYHPDAFASLDEAFDPSANAAYAARLLMALFQATGSWPRAAAAYHSMTPALGKAYQEKVLEAWATPDRQDGGEPRRRAREPDPPSRHGNEAVARVDPPAIVAPSPLGFGFNRRFLLPQAKGAGAIQTGKSLAAYRVNTVRFAWRRPG
jgi:hypothetical protein